VSLDSLRRERIKQVTGRDCLAGIMAGLMTAKRVGFAPIKINMVVLEGTNADEIDAMVEFCLEHGFVLRLIETMPLGTTGRDARFLDLQPVKERLTRRFGLLPGVLPGGGPARYLQNADGSFTIGFITPISQHFCATCNRVRLAVDGTLYLCLGQNDTYNFRPLLRAGADDDALKAAVLSAIALKPERHEFREAPQKILRYMSVTGG
jgi:cyclic pyranopterin phosphate synthase